MYMNNTQVRIRADGQTSVNVISHFDFEGIFLVSVVPVSVYCLHVLPTKCN